MIETIERQRLGFVATVDDTGAPRVSPKGTFVVIDSDTIAYGDISSPGSTRRLRANSQVEVNFVDPLSRKGLRATGIADVLARGTEAFNTEFIRFNRWGELSNRIKNIVVIRINFAKSIQTPAYDDGAKESDLIKMWTSNLVDLEFKD